MRDQIEIKRAKLKAEIENAEIFLKGNLKSLSISKYLVPSPEFLTDKVGDLIFKPKKSIASLDMVTRNILPKSNIIRKLMKYLNLFVKLFNQFSPTQIAQENR